MVNIGFSPKDFVLGAASKPFDIAGATVNGVGSAVTGAGRAAVEAGKGVVDGAEHTAEWAGDRAKDVAAGDPLGIDRRRDEATNHRLDEISEKLDNAPKAGEAAKLPQLASGAGGSAGAAAQATEALSPENQGKPLEAVTAQLGGDHAKNPGALASHLVTEGETLSGIAQGNDKSVEDLLKLNPELGDGNKIDVGQQIKLSEVTPQADSASAKLDSAAIAPAGPAGSEPQIQV